MKAVSKDFPDLTFIDLFSGAGGFSLGFVQEGFKDLMAIEINKEPAETYSSERYFGIVLKRVPYVLSKPHCCLIVFTVWICEEIALQYGVISPRFRLPIRSPNVNAVPLFNPVEKPFYCCHFFQRFHCSLLQF